MLPTIAWEKDVWQLRRCIYREEKTWARRSVKGPREDQQGNKKWSRRVCFSHTRWAVIQGIQGKSKLFDWEIQSCLQLCPCFAITIKLVWHESIGSFLNSLACSDKSWTWSELNPGTSIALVRFRLQKLWSDLANSLEESRHPQWGPAGARNSLETILRLTWANLWYIWHFARYAIDDCLWIQQWPYIMLSGLIESIL